MNPPNNWIGYRTIVRKEVTRILRIWGQTVVPPAITMTLYFIIFGNLIGRRIGEMGGFDYMQFIVPGLVMMSVITNSYGNMVSSFFGAKFGHHIEELLVSPLPSSIILAGYVTGALVRGLMVGAVVILVSLFSPGWRSSTRSSRSRCCCSLQWCSPWPAWSMPSSPRNSTISRSSRPSY